MHMKGDIIVFIFKGIKMCVFQVEARSIEGVKKQAKGLEMKIIELTQKLDAKVHIYWIIYFKIRSCYYQVTIFQ